MWFCSIAHTRWSMASGLPFIDENWHQFECDRVRPSLCGRESTEKRTPNWHYTSQILPHVDWCTTQSKRVEWRDQRSWNLWGKCRLWLCFSALFLCDNAPTYRRARLHFHPLPTYCILPNSEENNVSNLFYTFLLPYMTEIRLWRKFKLS